MLLRPYSKQTEIESESDNQEMIFVYMKMILFFILLRFTGTLLYILNLIKLLTPLVFGHEHFQIHSVGDWLHNLFIFIRFLYTKIFYFDYFT